jgi:hypothetical protein
MRRRDKGEELKRERHEAAGKLCRVRWGAELLGAV